MSPMDVVADGMWGIFLFRDCVRVCLDELWPREKECDVGDRLAEESEPPSSGLEKDIALLWFICLPLAPEELNPPLPAPETFEDLFRFGFAALRVTVARSITPAANGSAEDACIVIYKVRERCSGS